MKKVTVFELPSLHREPMIVTGFVFGSGEKNTVIVGPTRGNEIEQLYIGSQLVKTFRKLERAGAFVKGKSVEVIPALNPSSINLAKRFWGMDGTDINRMFPGYDQGETTQRIAAGIFRHVQGWKNGIQLASFYLRGDFVTHVRMMQTPYQSMDSADAFGLPFALLRKPSPIDTTTLNYNWQLWNTRAYSMLTQATDEIDARAADECVAAILRFLVSEKVLKIDVHPGAHTVHIHESELASVRSPSAGIFRAQVNPGETVRKGDTLGIIIDPLTGETEKTVTSRIDGTVFFAYREPLVMQDQLLFRIAKKLIGL